MTKAKIISALEEQHNKTGGHCGLYVSSFKGELSQIKETLNQLYQENKITVHDGIHGKLIKYKQ